ncbi:hypothetical protein SAMN05421831_10663 [Allopseudospirillum japonicum]|uniref:ABM domain-containing protein n=1 Tax=Allopseudospirillum japonicum TaxID=64971 RepID=A0A1H6SHG1_9GAMM|nr:antibiotic biosynthesis monooxygenase [Allopseudospirillum japonicum]SEI64297.1 hypothetical protein SAMN05421831_10663 [Allopseudospirillum japonicum]
MYSQNQDIGPITVSISRRVKSGYEPQYERWISKMVEAASNFPGHQSVNVLRPSPATQGEYVIIYRFDTYADCQRWETSQIRQDFLQEVQDWIEGESNTRRATGIEFWFDLPQLPNKSPKAYKMVLVLIPVVFILVYILNYILQPIKSSLPAWLHSLIIVSLQVILMTYLVMPKVTQVLKSWLFK